MLIVDGNGYESDINKVPKSARPLTYILPILCVEPKNQIHAEELIEYKMNFDVVKPSTGLQLNVEKINVCLLIKDRPVKRKCRKCSN
jgi:hypothetical protein